MSAALPSGSVAMDQILGSIRSPATLVHEYDTPLMTKGVAVAVCTYQRPASLQHFLESLATQDFRPTQLIIVDASPTDDTEQMLRKHREVENLADRVLYFRVSDSLRGLTRQRNFGVRWVTTDLIAFFDDDIFLAPNSLREMEQVHRLLGDEVAGVAAFIEDEPGNRRLLWQLMLCLRMVSSLRPGSYERSGISVPWSFLDGKEGLVEGDWLPGGATMWKTSVVREVGFDEEFGGYGQSEDLDFSLRSRVKGKLLVSTAARVRHLHVHGGRPDPYSLGRMQMLNRYRIHQRALTNRSWTDVIWFTYASVLDTLLLAPYLFYPRETVWTLRCVAGRLNAAREIVQSLWSRNTARSDNCIL